MRRYAALYNADTDTYSVIFQDDHDNCWFMYQNEIVDKHRAKDIAEAMTEWERSA